MSETEKQEQVNEILKHLCYKSSEKPFPLFLLDEEINQAKIRLYQQIGKEILEELKQLQNPYPASIFREPTPEQYRKFNDYLKEKGMYADAYNGSMGRRVWNFLTEDVERIIKEKCNLK